MSRLLQSALLLSLAAPAVAQTAPVWEGSAAVHGQTVPVHLRLELPAGDGAAKASFVNGTDLTTSSSGERKGNHLVLNFDYFAKKLEGDINGSDFKGTFSATASRGGSPVPIELHAVSGSKAATHLVAGTNLQKIKGDWEIAVKSPKGESAWTLRVSSSVGGQLKAVILRIDGDTNGLYGGWDANAGEYRVSRFAPSGGQLYSLKPQADGTLTVANLLKEGQSWTARRPFAARAEKLAAPTRATDQTSVIDPSKPLQYRAVGLNGQPVAYNDPKFHDKVVIVAIGGSWCPNCHDEAPFLAELYNKYHSRGLEVVNLSFEEEDQLKDPTRLRAFQAKYHLPYTIAVAGTPDQLQEKLPQGKNLNCWPTSFFIGRDGLVKETHAGFSGPATGKAYTDLRAETIALVEKLLTQHNGGTQVAGR